MSFMESVMWVINTLHVFDSSSIMSYTALGELNKKNKLSEKKDPFFLMKPW
jgi:hypothetical protein